MDHCRIAVLGGDRRELHIAELLREEGHDVALFSSASTDGSSLPNAASPGDAVRGAQWIVCPSPGLGDGDVVYSPGSTDRVVLDRSLLSGSDAANGGLVLGRATPTVAAAAARLDIAVFEMKDDRSLAISNGTSVAEAVIELLVGMTDRLLREHRFLVVGYGATGAPITDYLLDACCPVTVACRSAAQRARAEQRGASSVAYDVRADAMTGADIVINTVPDVEAVPSEMLSTLVGARIIDIASPPGGMDHDRATEIGLDLTWARGLAGRRAPLSVGEAQLAFLKSAMAHRSPSATAPA